MPESAVVARDCFPADDEQSHLTEQCAVFRAAETWEKPIYLHDGGATRAEGLDVQKICRGSGVYINLTAGNDTSAGIYSLVSGR